MNEIGRIFKEVSKQNSQLCRQAVPTVKCNRCLPLYIVLCLGILISETFPTSSAARVVTILEGETAFLNCTNQTLSGQVSYQWLRKGSAFIPQNIPKNTSTLVLPATNKNSSGIYHCQSAINGSLLFNESIQLIVQFPPRVIAVLPSHNLVIKPGGSILLRCIIDAVPPIKDITWTKDKKIYKVSTNISIPSSKCSDQGEYECFPSNGIGTASKNGSIKLIVKEKPGPIKLLHNSSTSTTITISWQQTHDSCLPVVYVVEWQMLEESIMTRKIQSNQSITIAGLKPFKAYGIYIQANNSEGSGPQTLLMISTSIGEPSEPLSVTAIPKKGCPLTRTMYVNWSRPLQVNGPIKDLHYQVYYENTENSSSWSSTNTTQWTNYTITNLNHSATYLVKVQACNKMASCCSKYSNVTTVSLRDVTCAENNDKESGSGGLSSGTIIALIIIAILVTVLIVLVVFLIKCRNRNNTSCCTMPFKGLFNIDPPTTMSRVSSYKERRDREAIPYERFWNHVILRHADSNYRFSSEFESLQGIIEKNKKLTWIHSQRPENQSKNRFANVVAYDQTRVVLSMVDNVQGSHYINANYIDSNNSMNFYIATQGPLANTISDFWRMVWEQNSRVIVMITNIIEKGRHKCAQYWPTKNKKVQDHGQLRVTYLREEHFAFYTQREFEVKPLKESTHYTQFKQGSASLMNGKPSWDATDEAIKPIIVQQYHFTGWPDHGVPDPGYEIPVLDFIFKSTAAQVEGAGPLIVHCSAGVGRSGAYIVIDSMVKRIHDNGDIDIFNFLCQIRHQRNHLVQEECQYIFVHDVILEYIQCGFLLSLPKKALNEHLHRLRTILHSSGKNKLRAEFERLKSIKIQDYSVKDGQKTCNINKNRNTNVIPVDSCRVKLYPRPGEEGSDYINASYIDGFWRREAYIATQYPLESTIFDFWRMIWQENCRTIVMLISKQEIDKTDIYPKYLPVVHDTAKFGVYEVTMESETARGDLMIRDLRMISVNEPGETRRIRYFHFLHWPEDSQPWSGQCLLQLVSKVDDWEKDVKSKSKPFDMIGPIVVHCSTGAGRTGVYCMLHTLWHQVVREEVVSVYPYSRLYFHQRLNFLQTQAQYEFIYDTMVEFIDADCSLYLV